MFKRKKLFIFSLTISSLAISSTLVLLSSCASTSNVVYPKTSEWNKSTNNYEKYINENELSLVFLSDPDESYVKSQLQKYITLANSNNDTTISKVLGYFDSIISPFNNPNSSLNSSNLSLYNFEMGTGWIFDYSLNTNSKITDYYIATNMHVLDCSYKYEINGTTKSNINYTIDIKFPINSTSTKAFNAFFSQPSSDLQLKANDDMNLFTKWYLTNLNKDNINQNIIPLGALNKNGVVQKNGYTTEMQLSIATTNNNININGVPLQSEANYYFYNNGYTTKLENVVSSSTPTTDISLLKVSLDSSKIAPYSPIYLNDNKVKSIFQNIQTMFDTNVNLDTVNKKSSYIARLAKLIDLTTKNKENSDEFNDLFLFSDFKEVGQGNGTISIVGFPGYQPNSNEVYSRFNCNTASNSLVQTKDNSPELFNSLKTIRPYIEVNYNGSFFNSIYDYQNNCFVSGFNLQPGSSGSMAMNSDYKIAGIYWGIISQTGSNNVKTSGAISGIYSKTDPNCILFRYLKYANINVPNSQLLKLFTNLNNNGYFK